MELCSFFIKYLGIRAREVMPGGGDFVSFFRPGGWSFAMESCPRGGDFDGKNSGPGVSPWGDGNLSN